MFGRNDIANYGVCSTCNGSKVDPKNRKRTCSKCNGSGMRTVCTTCFEEMPCSGTDEQAIDQTYCNKINQKSAV